jgi:hypothetical protein
VIAKSFVKEKMIGVQRFKVQRFKVQRFKVQGSGLSAAAGRERPVKSKKETLKKRITNIE